MANPYIVGLKVQYPAGTNLANVNITVRIESTNESRTQTTNSSGEANFNLGSTTEFPSGYQIGDVFSWVILYQGYEAYGSKTILANEGGYTKTIVLTAVPTAPSLVLFTPQEFLDYFNLKIYEDDQENGIKLQQLVKIGRGVEQAIENDCGTKFDSNNNSYYSFTELIDTNEWEDIYHISYVPIRTLTTVATTQNDEETTPDYTNNTTEWNTLTNGTHYTYDVTTGRIQITSSSYRPLTRRNGLYVAGTYGRSAVPDDIKELAIVETGLRMKGASFIRARISDKFNANMADLSWFESYRRRIIEKYRTNAVLIT